jgi:outer membrane protein assembly factor BamA
MYRLTSPLLMLLALLPGAARGQTRAEELESHRARHVEAAAPETNNKIESLLLRSKDRRLFQRLNYGYNGLGVKLGGMVTGGGFGFGPQYLRDDLADGAVVVRASAQMSTKNYHKADAQLLLPKLAGGKAAFDLRAGRRNYAGVQYYGPGPDTEKMRTNYRLEDVSVDTALSVSPVRSVTLGGGAGLLKVNVGPGADDRFASAETVFNPQQAPGIDRQTDFLRYGGFVRFHWLDDPFAPRSGGEYTFQLTRFEDRDLGLHDFNLFEVDLQQYIGFLNKSRVIALRAHTRMTDTRTGQTTPFYLQPVIGGSDDLRGFRPFRFSGNNTLLLSAEYRWAIFSGLDGAVFLDAGKVFMERSQLNMHDLETSAGFGLRFNARNRTFLRIDVGFSHEGFQVWLKFNEIFQRRPLGTADSQPIL